MRHKGAAIVAGGQEIRENESEARSHDLINFTGFPSLRQSCFPVLLSSHMCRSDQTTTRCPANRQSYLIREIVLTHRQEEVADQVMR